MMNQCIQAFVSEIAVFAGKLIQILEVFCEGFQSSVCEIRIVDCEGCEIRAALWNEDKIFASDFVPSACESELRDGILGLGGERCRLWWFCPWILSQRPETREQVLWPAVISDWKMEPKHWSGMSSMAVTATTIVVVVMVGPWYLISFYRTFGLCFRRLHQLKLKKMWFYVIWNNSFRQSKSIFLLFFIYLWCINSLLVWWYY